MKKYCNIKNVKKISSEQNPKSKVISVCSVQINELLVASQRVVSSNSKSWQLRVYHIVRCYPTNLRVASQQAISFQASS